MHRRLDGEMDADEARAFDAECERSPELRREYESLAEIVDLVGEAGRTELDDAWRVDTSPSPIGSEPFSGTVVRRIRRVAIAAACVLAIGAGVWWAIDEASRTVRESSPREVTTADVGDSTRRTASPSSGSASAEPSPDVVAALWIARDAERPRDGDASDSVDATEAASPADPLVVALPSEQDDIHIFWVYETGRGADLGSDRGKETGT